MEAEQQKGESTESVDVNVTDEQVTEFFASGGEKLPEEETTEETQEATEEQAEEVEQEASQEGEAEEAQEEETEQKADDKAAEIENNHFKALQEERFKRKELGLEVKELRTLLQGLRSQTEKGQETPAPDPEEDPLAYLQYQNNVLQKEIAEIKSKGVQQEKQSAENAKVQELVDAYTNSAREFAAKEPKFTEAYAHLSQQRMDELQSMGYSYNDAAAMLQRDELAVASKAIEDGVSPPDRDWETLLQN